MSLDTSLPPALFDIDDAGDLTPPIFEPLEPGAHGVALSAYGRHHGLGPGVFGGNCCDLALYGSIESLGRKVWIYHVCSSTGSHVEHKCDRCPVTWPAA